MKVALVYDRVNKWGGAERVLLTLHEMFSDAPLYTSVYNPRTAPWASAFPKIYTSFLQKWPWERIRHEFLAPLMPIAFESFDFGEYDLVISVTSEAAKGIITKPGTKHICYCLTPTRYLWSGYETYFPSQWMRWLTQPFVDYLRKWDKIAAQRPDVMIGISKEVVGRIKRYYSRDTEMVYPPVSLDDRKSSMDGSASRMEDRGLIYQPSSTLKKPSSILNHLPSTYFLIVSRLVPYKRVDLAIEAFNELDIPLIIIGTGSEEQKLKRMAKKNIYFTGHLTDGQLASYYEKATALIFPQEEDFGLTVVEAQNMGTPVIAFRAGGALETVASGESGEFFYPQTASALAHIVKSFKKSKYDPKVIEKNAEKFSKERFKKAFLKVLR